VSERSNHSPRKAKSVWPPLAALPLALLLILPLLALIVRVVPGQFVRSLVQHDTLEAIALSLTTSAVCVVLSILFGTALAHCLARRRFAGRTLVEILIDLPTVLPPAVAGIALLLTFGRGGLFGPFLHRLGVEVVFTPIAVILAQMFVAAPYYIKAATFGLAHVPVDLEEAAGLDGASSLRIFRYISVPVAWRALAGGAALCWARALGEFGATIIFAGNFPGRTQTMPLAIYIGFQIDLDRALALAAVMLTLSFGLLIGIRLCLGKDMRAEEGDAPVTP
jgi:molybdate transport system permease protein